MKTITDSLLQRHILLSFSCFQGQDKWRYLLICERYITFTRLAVVNLQLKHE